MGTAIIAIIISAVGLLVSIIFSILGAVHNNGGDVRVQIDQARKEAATSAKIETALNGIKSDTNNIRTDLKNVNETMVNINMRLVAVEQSTKSAHKRIDMINGKEIQREEQHE